METTNTFSSIVGQETAKRRLNFYLDGYNATNIVPHLMFVAPKGCGKTTLAKAMARNLPSQENPNKCKKFLEINCSTLKNIKRLFNDVIIPHVNHQECTILFDEASELPKDIEMALLTILNPNPEHRTTFSCEDYTVDFDFRRHTFMFATTEAQQIFHALMDRCERVDLDEYTYDELSQIVSLNLKDVTWDEGVLEEMATVLRGNARQAQKMAMNIQSHLGQQKRNHFAIADWEYMRHALGIQPLGLSPIEIRILRYLQQKKECSLTYLSAKTGLTKACLQRDFELYLQKHSLMEISTAGRGITRKGKEYLDKLDK